MLSCSVSGEPPWLWKRRLNGWNTQGYTEGNVCLLYLSLMTFHYTRYMTGMCVVCMQPGAQPKNTLELSSKFAGLKNAASPFTALTSTFSPSCYTGDRNCNMQTLLVFIRYIVHLTKISYYLIKSIVYEHFLVVWVVHCWCRSFLVKTGSAVLLCLKCSCTLYCWKVKNVNALFITVSLGLHN